MNTARPIQYDSLPCRLERGAIEPGRVRSIVQARWPPRLRDYVRTPQVHTSGALGRTDAEVALKWRIAKLESTLAQCHPDERLLVLGDKLHRAAPDQLD